MSIMVDELDPQIAQAFARARQPLADDDFMVQVLRRIERARRTRLRRWLIVAAVVGVIAALNLRMALEVLGAAVRLAGDYSPDSLQLLTSPAGWAASMLIGGGVLFFLRPSRR
ncbi:MAG: hypothetical protein WBF21_06960 [Steroidobacteraceae bacterium]